MPYHLWTDKTWSQTERDLAETFRKWGVVQWRVDGVLTKAKAAKAVQSPLERRVTVWWRVGGREQQLGYDAQQRAVDNFRALYLTLEALRMNEVRGIADLVREAYAQLPSPRVAAADTAYALLGVTHADSMDAITAAWKHKLWSLHPDQGGDDTQAAAINAAYQAIKKERRE